MNNFYIDHPRDQWTQNLYIWKINRKNWQKSTKKNKVFLANKISLRKVISKLPKILCKKKQKNENLFLSD